SRNNKQHNHINAFPDGCPSQPLIHNFRTYLPPRVLRPGFFAYSCLTKLPSGDVGCVQGGRGKRPARGELGPQNVEFASFSLEWLTEGADSR
ncbi:MAG: hypothetical protein CMO80_17680, partial [Verrucomicrobiales bacterium]|nr:hypothetical protein [Verrucomicrobiales bacterium]